MVWIVVNPDWIITGIKHDLKTNSSRKGARIKSRNVIISAGGISDESNVINLYTIGPRNNIIVNIKGIKKPKMLKGIIPISSHVEGLNITHNNDTIETDNSLFAITFGWFLPSLLGKPINCQI